LRLNRLRLPYLDESCQEQRSFGLQTYQDFQPKFLRELHQARHEKVPELSEMLPQNFLQDDAERWYLPDPARLADPVLLMYYDNALLRVGEEPEQGTLW